MEQDITFRRSKRRARRALAVCLGVMALVLFCAAVLTVNMLPAMEALATARIKAVTARAMNDAILDSIGEETVYAELIETYTDGSRVYMLQANTRNMNILAAKCADAAQDRIASLGEQGISIPVGTITGVPFFSGKGPSINVSFTPVGSVQSEFGSDLTASGINQTLYRVKLILHASVKLVMPGVSETIQVAAEVAISESILVGEVPEVYTNVANQEDMLNLIPTELP